MSFDLVPPMTKGDAPGHPFRGNQYTDGAKAAESAVTPAEHGDAVEHHRRRANEATDAAIRDAHLSAAKAHDRAARSGNPRHSSAADISSLHVHEMERPAQRPAPPPPPPAPQEEDTSEAEREIEEGMFGENTEDYQQRFRSHYLSLPKEVRATLDKYAEGVQGSPGSAASSAPIERMEKAIQTHGVEMGLHDEVFRGLSFLNRKDREAFISAAVPGAVLRSKGVPQSTSLNRDVADDFAFLFADDGVVLRISGLDGVKALPVALSGQSELVLSRDVGFVVSHVARSGARTVIHARVAR